MTKEIPLQIAIKEDIKNFLLRKPEIDISIEQYLLDILLGDHINKINLKDAFNNSLFATISSINKNMLVRYDTSNQTEMHTYFIEYLNTINKVLLSFNSFLLQIVYKYCQDNGINYYLESDKTLDSLFEPGSSNKNTIEDLFKFLIREKICYANQFFTYSLYESLFRHQMCHGWHNFFYYLLDNNNQSNPDWNNPTSKKKRNFLFDNKNLNLYDLRKDLKTISILDRKEIDLREYIGLSSYFGTGILEIQFGISLPYRKSYWDNLESFEPGSTLLYFYDLNGERSIQPDGSYYLVDLLSEFEKKELAGEFLTLNLSLNDLIKNIKITISDLLESSLI